jgi:hypothetical protein
MVIETKSVRKMPLVSTASRISTKAEDDSVEDLMLIPFSLTNWSALASMCALWFEDRVLEPLPRGNNGT